MLDYVLEVSNIVENSAFLVIAMITLVQLGSVTVFALLSKKGTQFVVNDAQF